jgi:hypothetical protein
MTLAKVSLVISHTPWRADRVKALREMEATLGIVHYPPEDITDDSANACIQGADYTDFIPVLIHDTDYRGREWQEAKVDWELRGWRWAVRQDTAYHMFMTDDLNLHPKFWAVLGAMLSVVGNRPIGLLSNHPKGPELDAQGHSWYRTNSWIVGPAYLLPHADLVRFLQWFEALPKGDWRTPGNQGYLNDDSSVNEWVTFHGPGESWHPLPTIIEHRSDVDSTVGHGDRYWRERVSWREVRKVVGRDPFEWISETRTVPTHEDLTEHDYWLTEAPMLSVGEN